MRLRDSGERRIGDYGVIGDCGTLALIDREGRLDWLCLPRFDSPSLFAAILDGDRGGYFWVRPDEAYQTRRYYLDCTNVLVTEFEADTGRIRLTDFMPVGEPEEYERELRPDHQVLRKIECLEGEVTVRVDCVPRPVYGAESANFHDRGPHGFFCADGPMVLTVCSELPLHTNRDASAVRGRERLRAGQTRWITLAQDEREPAVIPVLGDQAQRRLDETIAYWHSWVDACTYDGPYAKWVTRSALTMKLLTYSASGAIVAAGTTSLPEQLGGSKNWDYRYSWIRDSAFTLRALLELGYMQEGEAFFSWLLHSTRRTLPQLAVLYDVFGTRQTEEESLPHLRGYAGSRPVRIGNAAREQFQLDMYGILICAATEYCRRGGDLGRWQQRMLRKLGRALCDRWDEPDDGIWEERGPRAHHTFSVAMSAVGLETLADLADAGQIDRIPIDEYRSLAREIREIVDRRGWNEEARSYVDRFQSGRADASLLLLPLYGYTEAKDPRVLSTFDFLRRELTAGPYWYRATTSLDPEGPNEGTFGICGFWAVEVLAQLGHEEEAHAQFESMLSTSNDLGLFSEEYDPHTKRLLGNFPQAFTHLGLVNAALTLAKPFGERKSWAAAGRHAARGDADRKPEEDEDQEVGT